MASIRTEQRPCKPGMDGTVYILETGGARAEIWPALGFNCLRWQVPHQGNLIDLLWSAPDVYENPQPTRTGIPILFPFPNRIRDGRFSWEGKNYQLPINDPQNKNAIHGFACYRPWRVEEYGTKTQVHTGKNVDSAFIKASFNINRDAPEHAKYWPGNSTIALTYALADCPDSLATSRLAIEILVSNPGNQALPFGVGFHPYFRFSADTANVCMIPPVNQEPVYHNDIMLWELLDCLPTGKLLPIEGKHEQIRNYLAKTDARENCHWDDAYRVEPNKKQYEISFMIDDPTRDFLLTLNSSLYFRDAVVFTPPHREAVCVEPYTCITDAINLENRGIDSGLIVLPPNERWEGKVEMRCSGESNESK